jgi:hypothetical protein
MSSTAHGGAERDADVALADDLEQLVWRRPGLTELALAKCMFGRMGYQQRVNSTCRASSGKAALNGMGPAGPAIRSRIIQERSAVEARRLIPALNAVERSPYFLIW